MSKFNGVKYSYKGVKSWGAKAGHVENPLNKCARNVTCFCSSGKKIKNCCGRLRYITDEAAAKIHSHLDTFTYAERKAAGIK